MKKITVLFLLLVFILSGCKQINTSKNTSSENSENKSSDNVLNSTSDNSQIQYINPSQFTFSIGDGEITNHISKDTFTKPFECTYNGKKITINTPNFTGIPVEAVYSYKASYQFIDGHVIFDVATDNGLMYFKVDKNGKTVAVNSDYKAISAGRDSNKYMAQFVSKQDEIVSHGRRIGNDVVVEQFGEPGSYMQYLYSVTGERLSEGYDTISYFFNGLALVTKDKKIGIIDEKGNEVLAPSISFDTIVYPPDNKKFSLSFVFEDAFVISIDGEFAVINIQR